MLLNLLSTGPAYQQLTDLAKQSGLSLPTVHRLLRSLLAAGFVEQHPQSSRYSLGRELVRLSERYLGRLPVLSALAPYLVEMRNATNVTILVALLVRGAVVYVDRVDGEDTSGVYRTAHRVHAAFETAAGRVLVAHAGPEARQEAITAAITQGVTLQGICPHDFTETELQGWLEQPYLTMEDPQSPDLLEIAVPVTDQHDQIHASLSATASADAFTDDAFTQRVLSHLLRAASAVRQAISNA